MGQEDTGKCISDKYFPTFWRPEQTGSVYDKLQKRKGRNLTHSAQLFEESY